MTSWQESLKQEFPHLYGTLEHLKNRPKKEIKDHNTILEFEGVQLHISCYYGNFRIGFNSGASSRTLKRTSVEATVEAIVHTVRYCKL